MRFLDEETIQQLVAERFAEEIAAEADSLQRAARALGFRLTIQSVAGLFEVVTIEPLRELAAH